MFTDGACRGNPGPGGWGVLLRYQGVERELYGGDPQTTNNRMELQAAIEGLKALRESCVVIVTTDSVYVKNGIRPGWPTGNAKAGKRPLASRSRTWTCGSSWMSRTSATR